MSHAYKYALVCPAPTCGRAAYYTNVHPSEVAHKPVSSADWFDELGNNPEAYKTAQCPHCGMNLHLGSQFLRRVI